jgi:hypothetical protein
MLQNAVNSFMRLQQVKNTADQMGTTSGTTLTYDENTALLLFVASAYNDQFKAKKANRHVRHLNFTLMNPSQAATQIIRMRKRHLTFIVLLGLSKHMPPIFGQSNSPNQP